MKKFAILISGLLLASAATFASAQTVIPVGTADGSQTTVSGDVSLYSRDEYRGQEYSTDPSLDLGLKVDNIVLKGIYVDGAFSKVGNTFPLGGDDAHTLIESDVGVGYAFSPVQDLTVDLSAHHIYNAQEFLVNRDGKFVPSDYSELRAKVSYNIFFVEVAQAGGPDQNTYAVAGVNVPVTDKLHVGADVSGFHYKNDPSVASDGASNRYNNTDVFASYSLLKNLDVSAKYSFGGHANDERTLSNYGIVGVSYNF